MYLLYSHSQTLKFLFTKIIHVIYLLYLYEFQLKIYCMQVSQTFRFYDKIQIIRKFSQSKIFVLIKQIFTKHGREINNIIEYDDLVQKLLYLNLLMHSLTYIMKQSRPNKKPAQLIHAKKQAETPKRNIIYTNQDIVEDTVKYKRKFVQQSVFLPAINIKHSSQRKGYHERWHSQGNQNWKTQDDSDEQTMHYINECDDIIENLKKITKKSTEKLRKRQSLSKYADRDDIMKANNRNFRSQNTDHFKNSLIADMQSLTRRNIDLKQSIENKSKKQTKNVSIVEDQAIKDAKKQKVLVKFLSKAKTRGFQLQKKILEFREKKNEQMKQSHANPQNK